MYYLLLLGIYKLVDVDAQHVLCTFCILKKKYVVVPEKRRAEHTYYWDKLDENIYFIDW